MFQRCLTTSALIFLLSSQQVQAADTSTGSKAHYKVFPPQEADTSKSEVPARVELLSPAALSQVKGPSVTLKWQESKTADRYHLQVATDPNFKWLVKEDFHVKSSSYELSSLETGKHYFWRVAPVKSGNDSTFTKGFFATSSFETN